MRKSMRSKDTAEKSKKARGRQARTWSENLEEISRRRELVVRKARKIAQDKKKWKEIVCEKMKCY